MVSTTWGHVACDMGSCWQLKGLSGAVVGDGGRGREMRGEKRDGEACAGGGDGSRMRDASCR